MATGTINQYDYYKAGDRIDFDNSWFGAMTGYSGNAINFCILLPKKVPSGLSLDCHLTCDQYRVNGSHYDANSTVTASMTGDSVYITVMLATTRPKMVAANARISGYLTFV